MIESTPRPQRSNVTDHTTRRTVLAGAAAAATVALAGCEHIAEQPPLTLTGSVVDAHCHLFNGTDLPVSRFIREVVIPHNNPSACDARRKGKLAIQSIEDPDLLDNLFTLLVGGLLISTPSASIESEILRRELSATEKILSVASDKRRVDRLTIGRLSRFIASTNGTGLAFSKKDDRLRHAIFNAAAVDPGIKANEMSPSEIATKAVRSKSAFGATIRWVQLFLRHRSSLADELIAATRSNGLEPVLLTPLMVDYTHWLGETPRDGSSFFEQAEVFGAISRRAARNRGASIHGMCAYDPLRAVFYDRRARYPEFGPDFHPVSLAREAFDQHGFLGLKVYPPMGFKPIGNTDNQGYQPRILRALGSSGSQRLGIDIDHAMAQAFDLCVSYDAAILAHANNSVGAGPNYGARAEPRFWMEVLRKWPRLRLCLAHMGRFCWQETDPPHNARSSETTWEWTIGRYLQSNRDANLYMDISYLSEVLHEDSAQRRQHGAKLRKWIDACDTDARHIVYGTDWIMLGREEEYPVYAATIRTFLSTYVGLNDRQIERILVINALRCFGLLEGQTRERLLDFYRRDGAPLPAWASIRESLPPA